MNTQEEAKFDTLTDDDLDAVIGGRDCVGTYYGSNASVYETFWIAAHGGSNPDPTGNHCTWGS